MDAKINAAPCGTEAAYRRHLRLKETPCESCKAASNAARQERMANRGQGVTVNQDDVVSASDLDASMELGRIYATLAAQLPEAPPANSHNIAGKMIDILKLVMGNQNVQGEVPSVADEMAKARAAKAAREA